jgi:hypothetical protein
MDGRVRNGVRITPMKTTRPSMRSGSAASSSPGRVASCTLIWPSCRAGVRKASLHHTPGWFELAKKSCSPLIL